MSDHHTLTTGEIAMIPISEWKWFGNAGHFICSPWCQFHLCTQVGHYLVSTVGEYVPDEGVREIHCQVRGITLEGHGDERLADYMRKVGYQEIRCNRTYETIVFATTGEICEKPDCNCGMPEVAWNELDFAGYDSAGDATKGHYAMCEKAARGAALAEELARLLFQDLDFTDLPYAR